MLRNLRRFWDYISTIGIHEENVTNVLEKKKLIFFNQLLFIGLFATIFQILIVWPFLGYDSLIFLIINAASGVALLLNHKGYVWFSKRFFVFVVYSVGLWTTILLGGAGLYHLGVFTQFTATLILFDIRREKLEILLGIPFVVFIIWIGEFGIFNAADFSNHEWIQVARFANIFSLISVGSILTVFIIRLNDKYELALEEGKSDLERQVKERTQVLSSQKQELIQQNKEKEVLLKEVHHRVKNNLQVIISLINLQLSKTENKVIEDALNEIQSRVLSMSLVHKKMYQTSNFSEIGLEEYLIQMIENISSLYGANKSDYKLGIDKELSFEMEVAIPLGLIFNEIITNFYKHGRSSEDDNSNFAIEMFDEGEQILLKYSDNGSGFKESSNEGEVASLGLQLINSLSEQINAEIKYYSNNGAIYELRLKK